MMNRFSKYKWLIIGAISIGAGLRIYHLFLIPMNEPFRLGGLFYEFSRQIVLNGFSFPETIPYYSLNGIPFAYPPLSFYFQAVFLHLFDPPLFITVNFIPPIITILTIPAFYWMICQYSDDIRLISAGLFSFILMPIAYMNQVEGAGLAESFGTLFIILYLGFILRWLKCPNIKDVIMAGIILGLCILSSPGSAYAATIFSVLLFFWTLFRGILNRSLNEIVFVITIGLIGLLISTPYFYSVFANHGFDFFFGPFVNQHQIGDSLGQLEQIFSFQPGGKLLNFFWNWLILAGLIWSVLNRQFKIIILYFTFWFIPREGIWLVAIPASIIAGKGFVFILYPIFEKIFHSKSGNHPNYAPGIFSVIMLILLLANPFFSMNVSISDPDWHINQNQIAALKIFQDNIPKTAEVVIIGNIALAEWGPPILQREVLNIEYGLEWQPEELKKIKEINGSILEKDYQGMVENIREYTQAKKVFLISSVEEFENLNKSPLNQSIHPVTSTQDLR